MAKFLVTGGHGLIGHNVVQRLQSRGDDVSVMDTHTTYGIIPQSEVDYLVTERLKKLEPHVFYNDDIVDAAAVEYVMNK